MIKQVALRHLAGKYESQDSNLSLTRCNNFALNPRWESKAEGRGGMWRGEGHFPYLTAVIGQDRKAGFVASKNHE